MKTICLLFFSLFASTFFFACQKEKKSNTISCNQPSNRIEDIKQLIAGSYEWAYSDIKDNSGSFIVTPQTSGMRLRYVFDNSGTAKYYENGQLINTRRYVIDVEKAVTYNPNDLTTVVILNNDQGDRMSYFRVYLCQDSAVFRYYHSTIDALDHYKRN